MTSILPNWEPQGQEKDEMLSYQHQKELQMWGQTQLQTQWIMCFSVWCKLFFCKWCCILCELKLLVILILSTMIVNTRWLKWCFCMYLVITFVCIRLDVEWILAEFPCRIISLLHMNILQLEGSVQIYALFNLAGLILCYIYFVHLATSVKVCSYRFLCVYFYLNWQV